MLEILTYKFSLKITQLKSPTNIPAYFLQWHIHKYSDDFHSIHVWQSNYLLCDVCHVMWPPYCGRMTTQAIYIDRDPCTTKRQLLKKYWKRVWALWYMKCNWFAESKQFCNYHVHSSVGYISLHNLQLLIPSKISKEFWWKILVLVLK